MTAGRMRPDRDLDLSLEAGTLLGFQGLVPLYIEVLSLPPVKDHQRPVLESLFAVNDATANCAGQTRC